MLKLGESVASAFPHMIAAEMARLHATDAERQAVHRILSGVQKRFNYEEYGGAPLLGVNGNVLIGHGGSSARAIERMILMAAEEAREDVAGTISKLLSA
jgi:glycerol-3-phosphate acyltransferase PlsX